MGLAKDVSPVILLVMGMKWREGISGRWYYITKRGKIAAQVKKLADIYFYGQRSFTTLAAAQKAAEDSVCIRKGRGQY